MRHPPARRRECSPLPGTPEAAKLRRDRSAIKSLANIVVHAVQNSDAWDAATALSIIQSKAITKDMLSIIKSPTVEPDRRLAALHAISTNGDRRAVRTLVRVASDASEEDRVRASALCTLASTPLSIRSLSVLRSALHEPSYEISRSSATGLACTGDTRAMEILREFSSQFQNSEIPDFLRDAIEDLQRILTRLD